VVRHSTGFATLLGEIGAAHRPEESLDLAATEQPAGLVPELVASQGEFIEIAASPARWEDERREKRFSTDFERGTMTARIQREAVVMAIERLGGVGPTASATG